MKSEQWLEELYRSNYIHLYRLATFRLLSRSGTDSDAQDVIQDVFMTALKKREELTVHANVVGWLISTTAKTCNNYIRSSVHRGQRDWNYMCRRPVAKENEVTFVNYVPDETACIDIIVAIQQTLPADELELLRKYCTSEGTAEEIAMQIGISGNALRVRIHRIRKKLKKDLGLLETSRAFADI